MPKVLMTLSPFAAARAFYRVWGPVAERLHYAEDVDAGFDAGEFSGPWHADYYEAKYNEALAKVAAAMHASENWLRYAVAAYDHAVPVGSYASA